MAVLVDTAKAGGIKGGALASAIHAHSRHGDPDVRAFVSRVMKRLCVPIFQATRRWILEGELDDPHSEFYIASRRAVPADRLWAEK
jgi:gamma-tubulin complex component 3